MRLPAITTEVTPIRADRESEAIMERGGFDLDFVKSERCVIILERCLRRCGHPLGIIVLLSCGGAGRTKRPRGTRDVQRRSIDDDIVNGGRSDSFQRKKETWIKAMIGCDRRKRSSRSVKVGNHGIC